MSWEQMDFNKVKVECEKHTNCKIFKAVDKDVLFNIMDKCSVGIQYYDPRVSVNHLYASPSKLFEYLGLGLNVVSSKNRGIDKIIEENKCGVCFETNENVCDGLNKLLSIGLSDRNYVKKIYQEKYAYEVDSKNAIKRICSIIK